MIVAMKIVAMKIVAMKLSQSNCGYQFVAIKINQPQVTANILPIHIETGNNNITASAKGQ